MILVLYIITSYLLGAVPFGLLLSKIFAKTDIRDFGSKNIGATNVTRVLGKKLGLCTLILDGSKGAIMVLIGRYLLNFQNNQLIIVVFAAVIGHIFSPYLKFKGGKGVATFLASILAFHPWLGIIALLFWLTIYAVFKISSLGGIFSCLSCAINAWIFSLPLPQSVAISLLATIIILKHRDNIARLINNNEK